MQCYVGVFELDPAWLKTKYSEQAVQLPIEVKHFLTCEEVSNYSHLNEENEISFLQCGCHYNKNTVAECALSKLRF